MNRLLVLLFLWGFALQRVWAQQVPDTAYDPILSKPHFAKGKGPIVKVDQAHGNFHRLDTRFQTFGKVLRKDGYQVLPHTAPFTDASLQGTDLLVIANAVHPSDTAEWILPNPSAFAPSEIKAVTDWVRQGGALLLIADHMPMPGAAEDLGKAFGFVFYNGFATDTTTGLFPGKKKELDVFTKSTGTLAEHSITRGISQVATFTGQAFRIPPEAKSLLTFDERYKILLPDTAWKFSASTKRFSVQGFSQGAVRQFGKGRVAVFGEAAMFTAQRKGKEGIPFGLNAPEAAHNLPFLLQTVHWLVIRDQPPK